MVWDIGFATDVMPVRSSGVALGRQLGEIRARGLMRFLLIDVAVDSRDCGERGTGGKVSKKGLLVVTEGRDS